MIFNLFIFICLVSILLHLGNRSPKWDGTAQGYRPDTRIGFWGILGRIIGLCIGMGAILLVALGWLTAMIGR